MTAHASTRMHVRIGQLRAATHGDASRHVSQPSEHGRHSNSVGLLYSDTSFYAYMDRACYPDKFRSVRFYWIFMKQRIGGREGERLRWSLRIDLAARADDGVFWWFLVCVLIRWLAENLPSSAFRIPPRAWCHWNTFAVCSCRGNRIPGGMCIYTSPDGNPEPKSPSTVLECVCLHVSMDG